MTPPAVDTTLEKKHTEQVNSASKLGGDAGGDDAPAISLCTSANKPTIWGPGMVVAESMTGSGT